MYIYFFYGDYNYFECKFKRYDKSGKDFDMQIHPSHKQDIFC